jgi:hypothetical protein
MVEEDYASALEIAKRFRKNPKIQKQISSILFKVKAFEMENSEKSNLKELNVIRTKLYLNTISLNDIQLLDSVKDNMDINIYYFALAAIYEKLNLKNNAINTLKNVSGEYENKAQEIITSLKSKHKTYFNLEKYDLIINWVNDESNITEEIKINNNSLNTKETSKKDIYIEDTKKVSKKAKAKPNLISGTLSESHNKNTPKKKENIKEVKELSIYEKLDVNYRQIVFEIKLQFYKEICMGKKTAIYKYDELEEILNKKESNFMAFKKLLLIFIGCGYYEVVKNDYPLLFLELNERIEKKRLLIKKQN